MSRSIFHHRITFFLFTLFVFCFLSLSFSPHQEASSQKDSPKPSREEAQRKHELRRAAFAKGRWMLRAKKVPFDPDMLTRPQWRKALRHTFEQMPEMKTVRRETAPLSGVYIADTLSLPEKVKTTGDILILAREVVFDGPSPEIRGTGNAYIFMIEMPKSKVSIGQQNTSGVRSASLNTPSARPNTVAMVPRLYWSRGIGAMVAQTQGMPVDMSGGKGAEGLAGISPAFVPPPPAGTGVEGADGNCAGDPSGQTGGAGETGERGENASPGEPGQKPNVAGEIMADIPDGATGIWQFFSQGGTGGRGGMGGRGGKGGQGQKGGRGGDGVNCCLSRNIRGNGGDGGPGGKGGPGGNGADGGSGGPGGDGNFIFVTYPKGFNPGLILARNNGGPPGEGGPGGQAGRGGDPGDSGVGGDESPQSPNCNSTVPGGPNGNLGQGEEGFLDGSQGDRGTMTGLSGQTVLTERSTGNDGDGDGYAEEDGDCDDTDASVHPDAQPCCPGDAGFCTVEDKNCNGLADGQYDCANSPIIIDMRENGLDLTDRDGGVTFDFFASGVPINMAWLARESDDVFLVLDRNRNGRIDNGSELFGNRTPLAEGGLADNGFEALAEYDLKSSGGNENGHIDSGDRIYGQLRVWQDVNHNGVSEPGELKTLTDAGIQGLDIDYTFSRKKDRYGNEFRYRSTAFVIGEKKIERRPTYDVFFVTK